MPSPINEAKALNNNVIYPRYYEEKMSWLSCTSADVNRKTVDSKPRLELVLSGTPVPPALPVEIDVSLHAFLKMIL